MYHRLFQSMTLLVSIFVLLGLSSFHANATGYYNFGMNWKGAMNPYRLGGDTFYIPGFTLGGGSVYGSGDGMLGSPSAVAVSPAGDVYVADTYNHRISKYNSSGVFQGWMGAIATSPTGGAAGCSGAAVGTATPGWCTGGTGTAGAGDGMFDSPGGLSVDSSGNLYVADFNNNRIEKFNSSGVFQGWMGAIAVSPTGGDPGCNGAGVGTFTPGWCKGGNADYGVDDGMLYNPADVKVDSSGFIYVADSGTSRISKYNSAGVFQGWIGRISASPTGGAAGCNGAAFGTSTPGWCKGGQSMSGQSNGMMNTPTALSLDSSGNIYVLDSLNYRVGKYNSSGVFQGWIGAIGTSPTGGAAGCNGAGAGTLTPGWCLGGRGAQGAGDGMLSQSSGIVVDASGNIYVADYTHYRINKYNSSGVFQGWRGGIFTSPTGGDAGCNGATVGTYTPGWCKGGTGSATTVDGAVNSPQGMTIDSSGNIYVADSGNARVNKYDSSGAILGAIRTTINYYPWHRSTAESRLGVGEGMLYSPTGLMLDSSGNLYVANRDGYRINKYDSSGTSQGWIGKIWSSPTGGAAGCNGASGVTPGWCTGGVALGGSADGNLQQPVDVAIDSIGNLYVVENTNARISKYNSSGVFQGWIGDIATSPTGGAAGCNGASAGTFTPGWCTGGTSTSGSGDGMLSTPQKIALDSSNNIYVVDTGNHRINKYNSSGVFQGWIGKIATSPTGGAAGCNGASVGSFTPGWCTGGTSASGTGNGMMSSPKGLFLDSSGNLYVSDSGNSRINKYNSSGVFQGWIGQIATSPTGGAAGCNGASVGTSTPGWCTGGTSAAGSDDGMLDTPEGVTLDSAKNIYVADSVNHRISKYNSSGVFQGWIGKIATSPTGGATACHGAAVGTVTPGWCKGGTSDSGAADGMMNGPKGVAIDKSGNLYVADTSNHRIMRFSIQGR
jgi:sugar lactone lactonase YvrE